MEKRLITVKELADYISATKGAIYQMLFRREIPEQAVVKLGRAVRFDLKEIDKWIEGSKLKREF